LNTMESPVLEIKSLFAYYGNTQVLKGINLDIPRNQVTAIMGPSGCGKTTMIRCINRMHELGEGARVEGEILLNRDSIYRLHPMVLRRRVGMLYQRPNPFPTMRIFDNVIAGDSNIVVKVKSRT